MRTGNTRFALRLSTPFLTKRGGAAACEFRVLFNDLPFKEKINGLLQLLVTVGGSAESEEEDSEEAEAVSPSNAGSGAGNHSLL
eukprot:755151-Hanusia_phi.AAC.1